MADNSLPDLASKENRALAQRALEVIEEVRRAVRESGNKTRGRSYVDDSIVEALAKRIDGSALAAALAGGGNIPLDVQKDMMERFEETARRNKVSVSAELRPFIYRRLSVDLLANIEAFGASEKEAPKLASATLLQGNLADLPSRYVKGDPARPTYGEYFKGNESLFKHAAVHNPSDPAGFLDGVVELVGELETSYPINNGSVLTRNDLMWAAALNPEDSKARAKYLTEIIASRRGILPVSSAPTTEVSR